MAHRSLAVTPLLLVGLVAGCGGDDTDGPPGNPGPDCEAPEVGLPDGTCIRPGVPPEGCAEGFVHDGEYGCEPILPAEPCPLGLMAVPGETECRAIMECGEGTWGDLPVDGTTQHVDGAYAGGNSNGSAAAPWTTIGEAVDAAAPGALIAVAAGTYLEEIVITGKPVRLWGRCPKMVQVIGSGAVLWTIAVGSSTGGSEVGGLAIASGSAGVVLSGPEDVVLDRLWVHDTALRAIVVQDALQPDAVRIVDSLVEQAQQMGIYVGGANLRVERTVVRNTLPSSTDQRGGRGISSQLSCDGVTCDPSTRGNTTVRRSLIEQNHEYGLFVSANDVVLEGTVVRATAPSATDQGAGLGVTIQGCGAPDGCDGLVRANAVIRGTIVEHSHSTGIQVSAADALLEHSMVRSTYPRASDQRFGRGISIQVPCTLAACDGTARASATVRGVRVTQTHDVGLFVMGSDAVIESTAVSDTLPEAATQDHGRGMSVQVCDAVSNCAVNAAATASIGSSLVIRNHAIGVFAVGADSAVENTVVRNTLPRPSDAFFGDGIVIAASAGTGSLAVANTLIADSTRAGLANFGAFVSLRSSRIRCAGYELEGEEYYGQGFLFDDLGGNACGCPRAEGACVVESAGLAPPEPTAPIQ